MIAVGTTVKTIQDLLGKAREGIERLTGGKQDPAAPEPGDGDARDPETDQLTDEPQQPAAVEGAEPDQADPKALLSVSGAGLDPGSTAPDVIAPGLLPADPAEDATGDDPPAAPVWVPRVADEKKGGGAGGDGFLPGKRADTGASWTCPVSICRVIAPSARRTASRTSSTRAGRTASPTRRAART